VMVSMKLTASHKTSESNERIRKYKNQSVFGRAHLKEYSIISEMFMPYGFCFDIYNDDAILSIPA